MLKSFDDIHGLGTLLSRPMCKSSGKTNKNDKIKYEPSVSSLYCRLFSSQKPKDVTAFFNNGSRTKEDEYNGDLNVDVISHVNSNDSEDGVSIASSSDPLTGPAQTSGRNIFAAKQQQKFTGSLSNEPDEVQRHDIIVNSNDSEDQRQAVRRDITNYSNHVERGPVTTLLPVPQYNVVFGKSLALISSPQENDVFDPELEDLIVRFILNTKIQLILNSILSFLLQYVWSVLSETLSTQARLRRRERKKNEHKVQLDDITFWKQKNQELNEAFNDCSIYTQKKKIQDEQSDLATKKHSLSYSYLFDTSVTVAKATQTTKLETKLGQNYTFLKSVDREDNKATYCETIDGFSLKNAYDPNDSSTNNTEFNLREIVQQQISVWLDLVEENHFLLLAISRLMNLNDLNPILNASGEKEQQQQTMSAIAARLSSDVSLAPVESALQSVQNTLRIQQQQQTCLIFV